jgi:hypothetical protein
LAQELHGQPGTDFVNSERTMKRILLGALVWLCASASANAGLLGDTVRIVHNWPTLGTEIFTPMNVVVQDGTGDVAYVSPYYSVNVDNLSVFVDFSRVDTWSFGTFNGLVIADIDAPLTDFYVRTNFNVWNDSRFTYLDNYLLFNWNGLSFNESTYFELTFKDVDTSQAPSPATLALLGMGLAILRFCQRKAP